MWKRSMAWIVRHRQTKEPETDRPSLNHRATSRLYQDGSAFALTYRLLLRSCKLMGAFVISPLPPFLLEPLQTAGSLRSTDIAPLPRCRVGGGASYFDAGHRPPPKPCMQFSRTRLSRRLNESRTQEKELIRSCLLARTHRRAPTPAVVSSR